MPLYEYTCEKCGHEFEELVASANRRNSVSCPKCRQPKAQRRISVFAAREGSPAAAQSTGGCGRCGDPEGPCSLN